MRAYLAFVETQRVQPQVVKWATEIQVWKEQNAARLTDEEGAKLDTALEALHRIESDLSLVHQCVQEVVHAVSAVGRP